QLPGADPVERRNREEALPRRHHVREECPSPGERPVREDSRDAVGNEPSTALIPTQCARRDRREASVDRAWRDTVPAEPELEDGDVPAHRAGRELALSEQRSAA